MTNIYSSSDPRHDAEDCLACRSIEESKADARYVSLHKSRTVVGHSEATAGSPGLTSFDVLLDRGPAIPALTDHRR